MMIGVSVGLIADEIVPEGGVASEIVVAKDEAFASMRADAMDRISVIRYIVANVWFSFLEGLVWEFDRGRLSG